MKWLAHIAAVALLAATIGCGGSREVEATTEGAAPSADEMSKMAAESAERMPNSMQSNRPGANPNQSQMDKMMKEAMQNAPGGDTPQQ